MNALEIVQKVSFGVSHGILDYGLNLAQNTESFVFHTGVLANDAILDYQDRMTLLESFRTRQFAQSLAVNSFVQKQMVLESEDSIYRNSRKASRIGCELAPLAVAGYRIGKNLANSLRLPGASVQVRGSLSTAELEEYKILLRSKMGKPFVRDPTLQNYVEINYRPNDTIGNGSTAAAIRFERITGTPVRGRIHSQKGRDLVNGLERWLKNNPTANLGDRAAAENMLKDLMNALEE